MIFSSTSKKVLVGSLLLMSTTGLTFAANNYKGEANYKGEVMAAPCPTIPSLRDGFYVGLQGGYDSYSVGLSDNNGIATHSSTMSATGWVGGAFAGYGMYFTKFYLGGEAFINGSGASDNRDFNNTLAGASGSFKFNVNESYGLALLPGFKFTDSTLGYVRLGYNWAQFKGTVNAVITGDSESGSDSHTSNGFVYGVGMETVLPMVSDRLSLRAEYTYVSYSSFKPAANSKFSPSDNQFMLGLIYHI